MWVEGLCPRCAPKPKKKRPYLTGTAHPYFIDLTGQIFTRLTVEKYAGDSRWVCQCQCGATSIVRGKHLRKGRIRSCGCLQRELTGQLLRKDLTGRVFGHLTVTSFAFSRRSNAYWNCQCDCGATAIIAATSLTTGATRSCGCMHWKVPPEVMRAAGLKRERRKRIKALSTGIPIKRLRGEECANSKLTDVDVRTIRAEYAKGGILQRELAERYNVRPPVISNIIRYERWKHVI